MISAQTVPLDVMLSTTLPAVIYREHAASPAAVRRLPPELMVAAADRSPAGGTDGQCSDSCEIARASFVH